MIEKDHSTIHLKVGEMEADIDVEMAPIIKILWERGIKTNYCCQDINNEGRAHIAFYPQEAEKFIHQFYDAEKYRDNIRYWDDENSSYPIYLLNKLQEQIVNGFGSCSHKLHFVPQSGLFVVHIHFDNKLIPEVIDLLKQKEIK